MLAGFRLSLVSKRWLYAFRDYSALLGINPGSTGAALLARDMESFSLLYLHACLTTGVFSSFPGIEEILFPMTRYANCGIIDPDDRICVSSQNRSRSTNFGNRVLFACRGFCLGLLKGLSWRRRHPSMNQMGRSPKRSATSPTELRPGSWRMCVG